MKSKIKFISVLSIGLLTTSYAQISGGQYQIKKQVISSGGTTMTSNTYEATVTIGQADAGLSSVSNTYQAKGGFWASNSGVNDLIFKDGFE